MHQTKSGGWSRESRVKSRGAKSIRHRLKTPDSRVRFGDVRLNGKHADSNPAILGSNPSVPAKTFLGRPDSRVSQAVLKTVAA